MCIRMCCRLLSQDRKIVPRNSCHVTHSFWQRILSCCLVPFSNPLIQAEIAFHRNKCCFKYKLQHSVLLFIMMVFSFAILNWKFYFWILHQIIFLQWLYHNKCILRKLLNVFECNPYCFHNKWMWMWINFRIILHNKIADKTDEFSRKKLCITKNYPSSLCMSRFWFLFLFRWRKKIKSLFEMKERSILCAICMYTSHMTTSSNETWSILCAHRIDSIVLNIFLAVEML